MTHVDEGVSIISYLKAKKLIDFSASAFKEAIETLYLHPFRTRIKYKGELAQLDRASRQPSGRSPVRMEPANARIKKGN